ncbi:MAG: NAD+ synthase [Phycisphaerae bacterium]|nr:NAD+ synthase [Phycisphaerae bacterium]MDD5380954.1 NAD+ synthase [Phycisphaerae bacterium]
MRIALAQFNASVGDISGNTEKMEKLSAKAYDLGADIVVFPEMSVCGYPPEDLLLKKSFMEDIRSAIEYLAKNCTQITAIAGFAEGNEKGCFNSLAVLQKGKITKIYRKSILPNYGVFDERRYFRPGTEAVRVIIDGKALTFTICEDIWRLKWLDSFLGEMPRIDMVINISASPFHIGKIEQRQEALRQCAKHFSCAVAYCNLVGGQDELVFDGRSMFVDSSGKVICQAKAFEEDILLADLSTVSGSKPHLTAVATHSAPAGSSPQESVAEIYGALVLGTRDYVHKNGFSKAVIGLSGGIDSSLTAAIAADALGAKNVIGITMPSKFNSSDTIKDAQILADNLDIEFHILPIENVLTQFDGLLAKMPGWDKNTTAYENLQARVRGCILMSFSNQYGHLVLTTSNKSETAVGYATLYGDTAGGFAVLKDVPKTMVYQLAEYVNNIRHNVIPLTVIQRPPSAELRENQKDTDSLPQYDILDRILRSYVEENKTVSELVKDGLPKDAVTQVINMVDRNEYKRRQSPPGVKISPRAFGKDRRMPITNCCNK